jgi:L-ascorbate metabolism protein UlaG (beta-lactamase superfamily)
LLESGGQKVLIDPFLTGNPKAAETADQVQADLILISHGHGDHVGDAVAIAQRTGATVLSNFERIVRDHAWSGRPVTFKPLAIARCS